MEEKTVKDSLVPGIAVLGLIITGIFGILIPRDASIGDGLGIIGSAIAFGIILYVSFSE